MTLRLILMRHAKSDWGTPALADHDRPLNERGQRAAQALGNWMRARRYQPDLILCSSALRTRQTLAGLELDTDTRFERALYNADRARLLSVLKTAHDATCVLMIAHNPGISALAAHLARARPAHSRFEDYPTGATLVCDFDVATWADITARGGDAVDFTTPKNL